MTVISGSAGSNAVEDRMAIVRAKLRRDSDACQQARQRWSNWRNHVKAHPWLAAGLAGAVGYALVPGRRRKCELPPAQPLMPAMPPTPRGPGILGRIATEVGRRAAQQALAVGAAWALTRLRGAQLNTSATHFDGAYAEAHAPETEYAP